MSTQPIEYLSPAFLAAIKSVNVLFKRHIVLEIGGSKYEVLPIGTTNVTSIELDWKNVTGVFVPFSVVATLFYGGYLTSLRGNTYYKPNAEQTNSELTRINYVYSSNLQDTKRILTDAFIAKNTSIKNNQKLLPIYDVICGNVPINDPRVENLMRDYCKSNPNTDVCACISPVGGDALMKTYNDTDKLSVMKNMPCLSDKCKTFGYAPAGMNASGTCPASEKYTEPKTTTTDVTGLFFLFIFIVVFIILIVLDHPLSRRLRMFIPRQSRRRPRRDRDRYDYDYYD